MCLNPQSLTSLVLMRLINILFIGLFLCLLCNAWKPPSNHDGSPIMHDMHDVYIRNQGVYKTNMSVPYQARMKWRPIPSYKQLEAKKFVNPNYDGVPDYVLEFAPYVQLHSNELYYPWDISQFAALSTLYDEHKRNVTKKRDELVNIQLLETYWNHTGLFLTSVEDYTEYPEWVYGDISLKQAISTLIIVQREEEVLDAYWFYFYSFQQGLKVLGRGEIGHNLGDWQYTRVRFVNEIPVNLLMSQNENESIKRYSKFHKENNRAIVYAAKGTHAMYLRPGQHSHDLKIGTLSDYSDDEGLLWDPTSNFVAYEYDPDTEQVATLTGGSIEGREEEWGNWLAYEGHWGDQWRFLSDPNQEFIILQMKYADGSLAPVNYI